MAPSGFTRDRSGTNVLIWVLPLPAAAEACREAVILPGRASMVSDRTVVLPVKGTVVTVVTSFLVTVSETSEFVTVLTVVRVPQRERRSVSRSLPPGAATRVSRT